MWQSGTDGSPQRGKWEERRNLCLIEGVGVRLGATVTKDQTSLPGVLVTGGLARKDKWLCARAGHSRSVSPWGTSHCPNCKMKGVPLPTPGHSRGHLQEHLTGLAQARDGPFLSTSPLIYSPQNFSGIYYYYYKDAETQQGEEIFLTIIFDPKSGALKK